MFPLPLPPPNCALLHHTLWQSASTFFDASALLDHSPILNRVITVADVALNKRPGMWSQVWDVNCRALGAGEDLKSFDVDTKWGKQALDRLYGDVLGISDPMPGVQVH